MNLKKSMDEKKVNIEIEANQVLRKPKSKNPPSSTYLNGSEIANV
jgi:hypothetical protein